MKARILGNPILAQISTGSALGFCLDSAGQNMSRIQTLQEACVANIVHLMHEPTLVGVLMGRMGLPDMTHKMIWEHVYHGCNCRLGSYVAPIPIAAEGTYSNPVEIEDQWLDIDEMMSKGIVLW